jgi:hypothetical protein
MAAGRRMGRKWLQNRRIRPAVAAAGAVALAGATVLQVTNSWAAGATYYVDAAAGNDANPGTSAAPWRSLAKINGAALTAGDTVLLRRGQSFTGELTLTRSGTATARITIDAYGSGARPIVRGGHECIEIPASYVVVRRLHASDCGWAGVHITGSHNRFESGKASHSVAGVVIRPTATQNVIRGNSIVDNTKMSVNTPGGDDDSGAFGVLLQGDDNDIFRNTISGHDTFSYDYGRDGGAIEVYGGKDNVIRHNIAVNNKVFAELGNPRTANNTFAYNGVMSSLPDSDFLITRGGEVHWGPILGTTVLNNSVLMTGATSQGFVCHAGCNASILKMRNNVITAAKAGYADGPFDEDYGLYSGQMQFTKGSHSLIGDPKFVSASNLRLTAGSPAIDKGTTAAYSVDLDSAKVPHDGDGNGTSVTDMGAYEFGARRATTAAPTAAQLSDSAAPVAMSPMATCSRASGAVPKTRCWRARSRP